jgi:iron(III) transport system ATP-binding protein
VTSDVSPPPDVPDVPDVPAPDVSVPEAAEALSCVDVHKSFGRTAVLRGIDLAVPEGRILTVLGPSGCGKTTLLRIVAGFERADRGTVHLRGRQVEGPAGSVAPEHRRVGIVPQEGALFPHLSVGENVGFGLPGRARSRSRGRNGDRVAECLAQVGLSGYERARPHELSGGQQQRVALARALAPDPSLVVLDEPFSSLDPGLRASVRAEVVAALRASGSTAVVVTHDQEEALSMADEVAVLLGGRIAQIGDPRTVYGSPVSIDVATFVGEACLVPARRSARSGRSGRVAESPLGPLELQAGSAAGDGDGLVVVVRPEQISLAGGPGAVPATVVATTFLGPDATVELAVPGMDRTVTARVGPQGLPEPGAEVDLRVDGELPAFPASGAGDGDAPARPAQDASAGAGADVDAVRTGGRT